MLRCVNKLIRDVIESEILPLSGFENGVNKLKNVQEGHFDKFFAHFDQ